MTAPDCARCREGLREAWLARGEPETAVRAHLAGCSACDGEARALARIREALDVGDAPDASDALVHATLERARSALREPAEAAAPAAVPGGYGRELTRMVGGALASLPVVLAWNAGVLLAGEALLSEWLSSSALTVLGGGYVLAGAGWLSLLFGALPFLAHRSALARSGGEPA